MQSVQSVNIAPIMNKVRFIFNRGLKSGSDTAPIRSQLTSINTLLQVII